MDDQVTIRAHAAQWRAIQLAIKATLRGRPSKADRLNLRAFHQELDETLAEWAEQYTRMYASGTVE